MNTYCVHLEVKIRVAVYVDADEIPQAKDIATNIVEAIADKHFNDETEGEVLENRVIFLEEVIEGTS
jgi:hypothetical protein